MKRLVTLLLALVMTLSLVACGDNSNANDNAQRGTDQETYKIIYGGSCTESHPSTLTAYKFKELVEERSNGRIQVDVYINNTLGDSRSMLEGLQANEVQMTDAATGPFASFTASRFCLTTVMRRLTLSTAKWVSASVRRSVIRPASESSAILKTACVS